MSPKTLRPILGSSEVRELLTLLNIDTVSELVAELCRYATARPGVWHRHSTDLVPDVYGVCPVHLVVLHPTADVQRCPATGCRLILGEEGFEYSENR